MARKTGSKGLARAIVGLGAPYSTLMSILRSELRVAIATDTPIVRWQARCVEALAVVPGVALERWVQLPERPSRLKSGSRSRALAPVSVPVELVALAADPVRPAESTLPPAGDPPVDVLLDLSTVGVKLPVPWATEVWRFRYGEALLQDVTRAALLAYVRSPGRTRVALVREPDGSIIREGLLSWWRAEQVDRLLLDPAGWPAAAARERTDPSREPDAPASIGADQSGPPVELRNDRRGRGETVPMPLLRAGAAGRRTIEAGAALLQHDNWNIGIVPTQIAQMLDPALEWSVSWLPHRSHRWAADPFGIERDGVLHVVFEDFDERSGTGSISHVAISPDGRMSDPRLILDPGVHTSYPFLVEHAGATFMLPETAAAAELALYQAVDFPYTWRRVATLVSGLPVVDASVVMFEGRWWMFATRADQGQNHNLSIWHAPDLFGPWIPHRKNPVKTDARSARPGGTPFVVDRTLYRPSQDDSRIYGGRVVINRVDVLTPTAFSEQPVKTIGPRPGSPYPDGLHTLSAAGVRTLIDGNGRRLSRDTLRSNLASGLLRRQTGR